MRKDSVFQLKNKVTNSVLEMDDYFEMLRKNIDVLKGWLL